MQTQSKKENIIKGGVIDYYYTFDYIDKKNIIKRINILKKLSESELAIGHLLKNPNTQEVSLEMKDHFFVNAEKDNDNELLKDNQQRAYNRQLETIKSEITFTNSDAFNYKNTYILFPIKVELNNEITGFVDIYLELLDSGTCILNASFTVFGLSVQEFSINKWDINIDKAYTPKFEKAKKFLYYEEKKDCNTLFEIIDSYIEMIQLNLFSYKYPYNFFQTLSLADMTYSPRNFKNSISQGEGFQKNMNYLKETRTYQESIYTLLNAPIVDKYQIPYNVGEINEKRSRNVLDTFKLYATPNRIIYVTGKDLFDRFKKEEENEGDVYENSYISHRAYANFAVHKMLLKEFTNMKYVLSLNSTLKTKKIYNLELARDSELRYQSNDIFFTHASASELVNYLYEKCISKNKKIILDEAVERTNNLIQLNKEKEARNFNYIISIFTIVISVVFSISGIKDVYKAFEIVDGNVIKKTYIIFNLIILILIIFIFLRKKISLILQILESFLIKTYIGIINFFNKLKKLFKKIFK